jgi:hypothetical protein
MGSGERPVPVSVERARESKSPVFLILDGHPAHIAQVVAQYVQRLAGRLELHFLPAYAPELNPDESSGTISSDKASARPRCGGTNRSAAAFSRIWPPFNRGPPWRARSFMRQVSPTLGTD